MVGLEDADQNLRLSQQEALQKGISQLPKKRKAVDPSKLKYKCSICNRLTVHEIGEPAMCNVILESGDKCGKFSTHTRSFQQHATFNLEKKYKCDIFDHHFSKRVLKAT